jgi:hypothetical protein
MRQDDPGSDPGRKPVNQLTLLAIFFAVAVVLACISLFAPL